MPDTYRGDYTDQRCGDCGVSNPTYHCYSWKLVPRGSEGYFCQSCFTERIKIEHSGIRPFPIGQTSYVDRGLGNTVCISYPIAEFGPAERRPVIAILSIRDVCSDLTISSTTKNGQYEYTFTWDFNLDVPSISRWLNQLRRDFPCFSISFQ